MKIGKIKYIKYRLLEWSKPNRKKNKKHIQNLSDSYVENGMLRPFICTKKDKNGKHKLLDVSHGYEACEGLIGKDQLVPCYIIDWIDPDNITEVKLMIMLLNKNRKNWSIMDYVISHSLDLGGVYTKIKDTWEHYKKTKLTMGTVVASFSKESRNHKDIRNGKFVYDISKDKPITDDILETMSDIMGSVNLKNKTLLPNNFAREIVECIWQSVVGWNYDNKKFKKLLGLLRANFKSSINNSNLPGNKDQIREWYKNVVMEVI